MFRYHFYIPYDFFSRFHYHQFRILQVIDSLGSNDVVNKLLLHLEVSAIMEVFVKLMSSLDSSEMRMKIENVSEEFPSLMED